MLDFYATTIRTQIQSQFQYRAATYMYMLGIVAEPVIYLVVWTDDRALARRNRAGDRRRPVRRVLRRLDARPRLNIVFTPFGWEWRIREGELSASAAAAAPPDPLRARLVRRPEDPVVRHVRSDLRDPDPRLPPRPRPPAARDRSLPRRDLGRLRDPHAQPLHPRDDHDLDDARRRDLPAVVPRSSCSPAASAAPADAALGAVAHRMAAVQVDVLLPDRVARRGHVDRTSCSADSASRRSGPRSARSACSRAGGSRRATTRRWGTDACASARRALRPPRGAERAAVPRELLRRALPVGALGRRRPRRARARLLAHARRSTAGRTPSS